MNDSMKHTAADAAPVTVCAQQPTPQNAGVTAVHTEFFDSVQTALSAAAPPGACVQAINVRAEDELLRAGYRLVETEPDVVIARGGMRELERGRRAAQASGAKLILCPTHAFASAATEYYRTTDGPFAVIARGVKPFAAVFDSADIDGNLASVFGEIVSLDLCAFDCVFGAKMRGEAAEDGTDVVELITSTANALRGREKDRQYAARTLTDAGKTAARIIERRPGLLHCSGAAQMSEAVRMLYAAEEREQSMRGETEMLLGSFVADFYMKSLQSADGAPEFPPDNNKRIDRVCEYFDADIRRACAHASAVYPPVKMRICEYRRDEFRAEFMRRLAELRNRRASVWQVFKRLYPDDGYSLKTMIDKSDLGICLALAPDVFAADTMLLFLKQTGKLDKYIV